MNGLTQEEMLQACMDDPEYYGDDSELLLSDLVLVAAEAWHRSRRPIESFFDEFQAEINARRD